MNNKIDWEIELKKLESYKSVDDIDLYSNYSYAQLQDLEIKYIIELKRLNNEVKPYKNIVNEYLKNINLIQDELKVIEKKIEILHKIILKNEIKKKET